MATAKIPPNWEKWCSTGRHGGGRKKKALIKSLVNGNVRGYLSDLPLRPDLDPGDSMYPSVEHLVDPTNHQETVVEARIINDMKSHLTQTEFWQVIEHLFAVGVQKGHIKAAVWEAPAETLAPDQALPKTGALCGSDSNRGRSCFSGETTQVDDGRIRALL